MRAIISSLLIPALASLALVSSATAGEEAVDGAGVEERSSVTRHRVTIDGERVDYTATAGTMLLEGEEGEPAASVFYIAYTRDGVDDTDSRPITFTFNGGPGSSSVWLHMGTFGPKRVSFEDAEQPAPPPYGLVDNAHSILDVTDLVFIDPVGTGFSKTEGDAKPEDFLGVREDVQSVGEFIRLYVTRNSRWNSPKFLAGESYGTTRAAGLVDHLQNKGMYFNGVALVSSILNFQTARFETGNDLPYVLFLPTYAATAWYHDALDPKPEDLEAYLAEVREFAGGDYARALMEGAALGEADSRDIARRLAAYIGVSPDWVMKNNLRVSIFRFTKELLRDQRRSVGRLDSRYVGIDSDAAGESFEHDPSYTAIMGPYTAIINDYIRDELGFEEDREYEILSFNVNRKWNWEVPGRAGYVNVAENLRRAMSLNTHLEVFVANGYYDLATPFYATEYTMDHLGLEPELQDHIHMAYYPAGHMMYIHPPSLEKLKDDLAAFIEDAS